MANRALPLGYFMFEQERWGVITGDQKYVVRTIDGAQELYDLAKDPHEKKNLIATTTPEGRRPLQAALADATDAQVEDGWRIHLRDATLPFTLHFQDPVGGAGVIDPEAGRTRRANLEWGEVPAVTPADVADVTVQADGREVHVTPNGRGVGVVWILGPSGTTEARAHQAGRQFDVGVGKRALGGGPALVSAGTLIIPRHTEAAGLAEVGDVESMKALKALGYIE